MNVEEQITYIGNLYLSKYQLKKSDNNGNIKENNDDGIMLIFDNLFCRECMDGLFITKWRPKREDIRHFCGNILCCNNMVWFQYT